MNQGIRRLLTLVVVFLAAFALVYLLRNGPDGLRRLWNPGEADGRFRPERYTLPSNAAIDLDDVALLQRLDEEYARLTDAVVDSVVSINTTEIRGQLFLDGYGHETVRSVPTPGQGSGVIVTHEGHVVTNEHVIRNKQHIQVTLSDGRSFTAVKVGEDPLLDVAVLKIDGNGPFQPLKFGDSTQVRRGQIVFAVGNPFGLGETITQGIISAVERSLSDTQRDLFQTDAAINPGNSGGPLVNLRGEIIGINSAIYRPDERVESGFQGVGFSIPSNDVRQTLLAILERGRPIRGYLGVQLEPNARIKNLLGYRGSGVVVHATRMESPARRAGLKPGDVIVSFNGDEIESEWQLVSSVQREAVGESVSLGVWREGETFVMEVQLIEMPTHAQMPEEDEEPGVPDEEQREFLAELGLEVRDSGRKDHAAALGGAIVLKSESPSAQLATLRPSDHIIFLNGQRCPDSNGFATQLREGLDKGAVKALLIRRGMLREVMLNVSGG